MTNSMVSCLCPTFNRPPDNQWMLEEAVESFLRQDYADKELIVCNDTPGQTLVCDAPGVRVLNVPGRFTTLSDKLRWMIRRARGEVLCRWDDDDVCLPPRLSYSMARLADFPEWRSANYWYYPASEQRLIHNIGHGNSHICSVWRREVLERIGGYPEGLSGIEDQAFNRALESASISRCEPIPVADVFYLYRFGLGRHLSQQAGGSIDNPHQPHYDQIGQRPVQPGRYELRPHWRQDYQALAVQATQRSADPPQQAAEEPKQAGDQ